MAKKKSQMGMILNIALIVLSVLTICTLFMPIIKSATVVTDIAETATGADVFSAAFAKEASSEMTGGANLLYGMRTADENSFVAVVMMWAYMLTVLVSVATLVFAVLGLLGMRFKLVNTILGAALVVLALVTFIFALIVASKNTSITEVLGKETGVRTSAMITAYLMFASMIAGGLQVYKTRV